MTSTNITSISEYQRVRLIPSGFNSDFNNEAYFAIQVIAVGSYVDVIPDSGIFLIEVTTIRLNTAALNEYMSWIPKNCRDCYETDEEYEGYISEFEERREDFKNKIIAALEIDSTNGIVITQSHAEVFTVVHMSRLIDLA